jgi:hypothetical protein
MKTINDKITELLKVSREEGIKNGFNVLLAKMKRQEKLMDELKALANAQNTIVGRIIKFPRADSHAYYIITKVNKRTVRIKWINYSDGQIDDRCGSNESNLEINYAMQTIAREDALEKIFGRKTINVYPPAPIPQSGIDYYNKHCK